MELRNYWNIVRERWQLVLGLPALVALLTLGLAFALPRKYAVSTSMLMTLPCFGGPSTVVGPNQERQFCLQAAEFINDDSLQLVETPRFAHDIAAWVAAQHQQQLDPVAISKGITSDRKHRMLTLDVTGDSADHAVWIAQGAIQMLQQNGLSYWKPDLDEQARQLDVSVVAPPDKALPAKGLGGLVVDVVLRSLLALLLAVGIAFLLHYLDQSLRRPADVEALGFPLVGAIPADGGRKR